MSSRNLHILILVSVAYVAAQMVADITNLRDLTIAGYAVSAFSIAHPLTYTLRDMVHKLAGPYVARTLIIAAAVICATEERVTERHLARTEARHNCREISRLKPPHPPAGCPSGTFASTTM